MNRYPSKAEITDLIEILLERINEAYKEMENIKKSISDTKQEQIDFDNIICNCL